MKQVLQRARTGEVTVVDVPMPKLLPGCVLVRIAASVLSAGTERASSEFAGKNLLQKAKARPDLVRQVLNKTARDGVFSAISAVRQRLDQPAALGYSSAGTVIGVGEGVNDINIGDRVACAGAGYAVHADFACVPRLLVSKLPAESGLGFDEAAFTTLGAIAIHGVRMAEAKLGEVVAVIGLGLLGQITVQILKAAGCHVVGVDILSSRASLAVEMGADAATSSAEEFRDLCLTHSSGRGADAVLITAETLSGGPVSLAAQVARDRAIVVAVGTVGMDLPRRGYFEKELDFRVSRSYGPGRYDSAYEQKGRDYPAGYVRWTETRNMGAVLRLMEERKLNVSPLITHRFPIERAASAYEMIAEGSGVPYMGILIEYADHADERPALELVNKSNHARRGDSISIGLIGAGNFANSTLLPAIKRISGVQFASVASASGAHARYTAEKFGFQSCTASEAAVMEDSSVNTVVIATRHHLHAEQVVSALDAGKNVFCEKPLCLNQSELREIIRARSRSQNKSLLMVGFNRRFAPLVVRMKNFLQNIHEPLAMHYRVNAGYLPADHWINDPEQGGGRILGEACHFIDLLSFLAGALPVEVHTRDVANSGQYSGDNVVIALRFSDGSQGTITYVANGCASFSKERIEIFGGNAVAVLDDFRRCEFVRHGKRKVFRSRFTASKGHKEVWSVFSDALRGGTPAPIPFDEIITSTLATFAALDSRYAGQPQSVDKDGFLASCL